MTSRRRVKKLPKGFRQSSWMTRAHKRYRRAMRNNWPLWLYYYWAQPDCLHGRFDHASVLARKPRAGRRRR